MTKAPEVIEFSGDARAEFVAVTRALAEHRDGWVNLSPRVDPERLPPTGFGGIFSARGPAIPLATWVPATTSRKGAATTSLGLQHPLGCQVSRRLLELGIAVPAGYRIVTDNPKRGLVMESAEVGDPDEVADWMIRASGGLSPIEFDQMWVAAIVRY